MTTNIDDSSKVAIRLKVATATDNHRAQARIFAKHGRDSVLKRGANIVPNKFCEIHDLTNYHHRRPCLGYAINVLR